MSAPMHADDYERVLTEVRSLPERPDLEQEQRLAESKDIKLRLPAYLRHPKGPELLARVSAKEIKQAASAWRVGSASLVFLGPTKIGKSTAAGWLFRRLVFEGVKQGGSAWSFAKRLAWFHGADLELARREHPLGKGDCPEVIEATKATLLVLDDAAWGEKDPTVVSDVLRVRYEAELPTVITSGRTREELLTHYGAAVVRRMLESGGQRAVVVDCFPKPGEQARLV